MNIYLQKALESDWKEVDEFEKSVASVIFHATTGEEPVKDFILKNEIFFIIYENVKVGILAYRKQGDGYYISELIISPKYQGKGVGACAFRKGLDQIGNQPIELNTHPDNSPAICLYLKMGFKIKGWKDNYYGDGEPRLILIKNNF